LSRTSQRIDDTQKFIEAKNYDLRNKQMLLDDTNQEGGRLKEVTNRLFQENSNLKRQIDGALQDTYELRKEYEY